MRRNYNKNRQLNIEKANVSDPKTFWKYLSELGPKKLDIPWKIDNEDGSIITDKSEVKERWASDFEKLYINEGNYDENVLENKIREWDNLVKTSKEIVDPDLDGWITYDEVSHAVSQAKCNKAVGIDRIANEVLKKQKSN